MSITEQIVDEIERLQELRLDDRLTYSGSKKLQDYKTALKVVENLTIPDVVVSFCPKCNSKNVKHYNTPSCECKDCKAYWAL